MAVYSKNVEILHIWNLATGFTPALTGLVGNMTTTLLRFPDSSTQAAASETVTAAEIGSTGYYSFTYTPTLAQVYQLHVSESSFNLSESWEASVVDTPPATVADNAYCTEADVVAWAQAASDYTTTTVPTQTQVLAFMVQFAADLYMKLVEVMGSSAVGPSGATNYATEIDTSTDVGFALSEKLRMANAVGAAAAALDAAGSGEQPARSERVGELLALYDTLKESLMALAELYLGFGSRVATHISTGEITAASIVNRTAEALPIDDTTEW